MFGKLKQKLGLGNTGIQIPAPLTGEAVPLSEVNDPTFSEEILGKGAAIRPTVGKVVSPVNGSLEMMFDTGHAVSILSDEGVELLIHVGLDTVKLGGKHYTIHAHSGDKIKVGDVLMEFDIEGIRAEGYDVITPVVICNTDAYSAVEAETGKSVSQLDSFITLKK